MIKTIRVSSKFIQEWNKYNDIHPRLKVHAENIRALEYDLSNVKTSTARKVLENEIKKLQDKYNTEKENIELMEEVNSILVKEGLLLKWNHSFITKLGGKHE